MAPSPGYLRLSYRLLARTSIRGAAARSSGSVTSQMARSVLVPPMSPARTCMPHAPYRTRREDQACRRAISVGCPCWKACEPQFLKRAERALTGGVMRISNGSAVWAAATLSAVLSISNGASAQLVETTISPAGDYNWSATAGRTAGNGNAVLQAEAGWPGLGLTYLKGLDERTDVGFHVGFNYGFEGTSS